MRERPLCSLVTVLLGCLSFNAVASDSYQFDVQYNASHTTLNVIENIQSDTTIKDHGKIIHHPPYSFSWSQSETPPTSTDVSMIGYGDEAHFNVTVQTSLCTKSTVIQLKAQTLTLCGVQVQITPYSFFNPL
ncbi:hypothetical protein [Photobacterium indicum]|uniref:hypothetical protein n=1 Tax=Photobacterium indicum TaxID=81447 RepID=UPI003D149EA4